MSLPVHRYGRFSAAVSALDPFEDVLSWIGGLRSREYAADLLRQHHGITERSEIKNAAATVATNTTAALGLIEQAASGPAELSFLPLYYAILNLSKIYVALGPHRADLPRHRHHGASYNPEQKSSRDIRTETIGLKPRGVLGLFYTTLTGQRWYRAAKLIRMSDVLPFVASVAFEYGLAFGAPAALASVDVTVEGAPSRRFHLRANIRNQPPQWNGNMRELRAFRGLRQTAPGSATYTSPNVMAATADEALAQLTARHLRSFLFYDLQINPIFGKARYLTPVCSRHMLLPEELPIWLLFFHMSSIVRYKPEFLSRLRDSRSWPYLLAVRRQAMFRFVLLFWSYLHQTTFHVSGR